MDDGVPDDELVARSVAGDLHAYGALVRRHEHVAFRTALAICGSRADAEDAAQDAVIKAYRSLGRFRAGAPWRPWLLSIVANEARNRRRSAGRREHLAVRAAGAAQHAPDPVDAMLAAAQRRELVDALAQLDPPQREVVVLRHLVGLSEAECAAVLGCRPGTVKSRLSRALDRLRTTLEGVGA